ncbi:hypothetical protein XJ32_09290 [Helicobacter bilis]|uniref:DNA replication/recombination mediator RecO N-terminal domain-containing protein n=2 Tax=Helicobacter bilis TaxID=37372 RepID=C3XGU8_9HELI|nr:MULTISPECIES: recombination protein RecO [Helicobacter]AQQ60250.1 hypothetical protein XJ32_09290 [Helicobacter bilis]EEO24237.1 hypothetical protein HRAG_01294 [Helicobacter bilis ATCC 43879]
MQGFILKITKSIREDVIVKVLTQGHYHTLYRFYGARHNILYTGRKIDFEIEYQGVHIPKLRNLTHLPKPYEVELDKVYVWQQFCALLDKHLHEAKQIESFYFELMEHSVTLLHRQNARRLICSMYASLLEFEGRLYREDSCFACGALLHEFVALTRGFLFACPSCVTSPIIMQKQLMLDFYETKSLINIDDINCDRIYEVVLQGL